MPPSWQDSLPQLLKRPRGDEHLSSLRRACLVGIGSDLRGDDSAGLAVARTLLGREGCQGLPNLLILEGGLAPENQTGILRAFRPELVLFVDAAQMDEPPGAIRWIPLEGIDGMSASSHSLPLSMLAEYLTAELGCEVVVLGIQPGQNDIDAGLTPAVHAAVAAIVTELEKLFLA